MINLKGGLCEGSGLTETGAGIVEPPGNQTVNGENKRQPAVSGETGLLDSKKNIKKMLDKLFKLWEEVGQIPHIGIAKSGQKLNFEVD